MNTRIPPAAGNPHDAMDSFIAALANFYDQLFNRHEPKVEIAFSDEFERKLIAREFHLN